MLHYNLSILRLTAASPTPGPGMKHIFVLHAVKLSPTILKRGSKGKKSISISGLENFKRASHARGACIF